MMWSKKTVIISLFSLILIVLLGYLGFQSLTKYPKGSQVANVLVEGLSKKEARELLQENIGNWEREGFIYAKSDQEEIAIPRSAFEFDVDETLNQLRARTKGWVPFVKKSNIVQPLLVKVDHDNTELSNLPTYVDAESTLLKVTTIASNLGNQPVEIDYANNSSQQLSTVAKVSLTIPEELSVTTVSNLISQLNEQSIRPEEIFSILEVLSDISEDNLPEIDFIVSGLYAVVLQTNLTVLERHSQGSIPVYSEPGIEASVNPRVNKDLVLYNSNDDSYRIGMKLDAKQIHITLESLLPATTVSYQVKKVSEVQPRTVYRYSEDLRLGESRTIQEGTNGLEVEVYKTGLGEDKLISIDFYPPEPTIVLLPISSGMLASNDEHIGSMEEEGITNNNQQGEDLEINDGSELELGNVSDNNEEDSFYDFVSEYCTSIEMEQTIDAGDEQIKSCIENLDRNQLQLLRLIWASNNESINQHDTIDEDNPETDTEEEQIYVK